MCGLFGIAGHGIIQRDLIALQALGIISQLRGVDGFGCYQKGPTGNGVVCKTVDPLLIGWPQLKKEHKNIGFLDRISSNLYMCHVRAATKGTICEDNSHPFVHQHMVVAHNGTLKDPKYQDKVKADSMLMTEDIANRGIKKVLEDLDPDSAYALTIWDNSKKRLYFARNEHRTLHMYHCKDRAVVYWASEKRMLDFIFDRFDIKKAGESNFNKGKLYDLDLSKIKMNDAAVWIISDLNLKEKTKSTPIFKNRQDKNSGGTKNNKKGKSHIPDIKKNSGKREKEKNKQENNVKIVEDKKDPPDWVLKSYYESCSKCGAEMSPEQDLVTPLLDGETVCNSCWKIEVIDKKSILN